MANTLAALLAGIAGGAGNLYQHRQRKEAIARDEADKAEARKERERQFREMARHNQMIEALQQANVDLQRGSQDDLRSYREGELGLREADLERERVNDVVNQGKAGYFVPRHPESYAAADKLGFPRPTPIVESMQAGRAAAAARRGPVDTDEGTFLYQDVNDSSNTSLYNGERTDARESLKDMFNIAQAAKNAVYNAYQDQPWFNDPNTPERQAIDAKAQAAYEAAIARYIAERNRTHATSPGAPPPAPRPTRRTGAEMFPGATPSGSTTFSVEDFN